jgi:ABC-type multidrug transport system fused ATPase/permease subunit
MVSVERLVEYTRLDQEAPLYNSINKPPPNWPEKGEIVFKNYKMRYRTGLDLVLKGVDVKIAPREKVGIVGRTGAGKSSLILAIFRLVEASEGSIIIDDYDISKIGLFDLRSKLSIIPQDPILFTGTVRSNLDPFNECEDKDIWEAINKVHLSDAIKKLNGLDGTVTEGGENFSVGQRQL